jgi:hypothetical protein
LGKSERALMRNRFITVPASERAHIEAKIDFALTAD